MPPSPLYPIGQQHQHAFVLHELRQLLLKLAPLFAPLPRFFRSRGRLAVRRCPGGRNPKGDRPGSGAMASSASSASV